MVIKEAKKALELTSDPVVTELLREISATLTWHIDNEENTLNRIEKLLDGNGQPGLIREHLSHREAIAHLETWKAEMMATRRWLIGVLITVVLALIASAITLFRH